ncbi:DHH phosphoesterase [Dichomitus squalens]|uniref:DHH phosphoesterase n=1 Tax=Dichomitus squalens TaxID=114155 RepID=A0A4Q9QAD1_9APHY|nr:DHH phosphoesterase [Dichomitus squalens]TBU63604.1 DHH phosphoesterase [Dichomitus squalens]
MPMTLSTFLKERNTSYLDAVKSGKAKDWTVVVGNEAGDLDSIASAIAFAWYASKVQGAPAVSLTQTPRSDLHLRAENLHAFGLAQLSPDTDILCIDDVPYDSSGPFPSANFALVDHNRLNSRFTRGNPDARVVAVVDHHQDEGLYRETADPRLIVVPTGSCASLVTQLFDQQAAADDIPPELATLLLCSILIDTGGLRPGGKAEAADHRAASLLIPRAQAAVFNQQALVASPLEGSERDAQAQSGVQINEAAPHETPGLKELHTTLQEKKASVAHLRTHDLLRRDYKEYSMSPAGAPSTEIQVGLSSVPIGFAEWLPRHGDDFFRETERYMAERGLKVLGILTSFRDEEHPGKDGRGKHRREQMYVVRGDKALADALFDALAESEELKLKRVKFPEYGVHNGFRDEFRSRVWQQKNVDATRKATAPLVKSIIEGRNRGASL